MDVAPEAVDLLVSGGDVVTMDGARRVLRGGAVAVSGNSIVWVGDGEEAARRFLPRERIDARGRLVMPGMIDAHVHTAQHFLRGKLAEVSRQRAPKMPVWKHYYLPYEALLSEDDVYLSGLCAYANMLLSGTTCFAEAGGPHPDAMARAAEIVGIRGFVALSTVDQPPGPAMPAALSMTTDEAIARNLALFERWSSHPRVNAFLALRQIVVCSPELITAMADAARKLGTKIHTHLAEGTYEVDYALERFGRRPTEYLEDLGALGPHLHCAHSILLSPDEVDLYASRGLSACHCGFHNYALGHPRVAEMWRRGIAIGLGTDGAASSSTLDIFQVAHVARIGQQILAGTPWHMRTALSAEDMLSIALDGGARALGQGGRLGVLAPGAKADILIVRTDDLDHQPLADPLFAAANTVVGRDVESVLVDGRLVVKDRQLLGMDLERIRDMARRRRPEIMRAFDAAVA